jgi:hypothetical protein
MHARRSIFVIFGMALLASSFTFNTNQHQKSTSAPFRIADGTRPLPPIPMKEAGAIALSQSVQVADGTRPLPPIPTNKGQFYIA